MLIHNVTIVNEGRSYRGHVVTDGAFITEVNAGDPTRETLDRHRGDSIDGAGAMLLPGAIDCHVHFREPGMTHKATIATESRAAVAGGVTSYVEMPNTRPATTSIALLEEKEVIAARSSAANYAFMIGATADNIKEILRADYSRVAAVKVFMGSSTGNMLVDDERTLSAIFSEVDARIVVHAEDDSIIAANTARARERFGEGEVPVKWHSTIRNAEACIRATDRALEMAARYGSRLHVAHVSTAAETRLFDPIAPDTLPGKISAEVSPHHLLWTTDDYGRLGARIKMNPSVKTAADREALRQGVKDGRLSLIATDHAPHLLDEKRGGALKAVSGAPLVQFSLAASLSLFDAETVARAMAHNPARLFGIDRRGFIRPGYYADIVLVRPCEWTVSDSDSLSLCGWTPLAGTTLRHKVAMTVVNGEIAFDGTTISTRSHAKALSFDR